MAAEVHRLCGPPENPINLLQQVHSRAEALTTT
jgi:hypothetical protein